MSRLMDLLKKGLGFGIDSEEKRPVIRRINTLLIVAAAGILMIVLANTFGTGNELSDVPADPEITAENPGDNGSGDVSSGITGLENKLAQRLEQALTQISGAGKTRVTVNLASTTEKDYAVNTSTNRKDTLERDQKGSNRTITEINEEGQIVLVRETQGSREMPVVVKEIEPEVKGVIVISQGAGDPEIKASLMQAVQVYLDVPLYRVVVLPMESR